MLIDIKNGTIAVDLILVDTLERFGRVDELQAIRKTLYDKYGVLVLTADSNFADPNSPQGKAMGMFEAMRATEDGRIKAHNVLRGKRDAATQKHWPGGPPPFGYRRENVMRERNGCQEVDHSILMREPTEDWIIHQMFIKAADTGWGTLRLSYFLNDHPDIPTEFKPFHVATIGHWLDNPIYYGELLYNKQSTDIIDDARVVEAQRGARPCARPRLLQADHQSRALGYGPSHAARTSRSHRQTEQCPESGWRKAHSTVGAGSRAKYLLSGLLRCGICGRSMICSSSPQYTTKAGVTERYINYICPVSAAKVCPNRVRVPEDWLRHTVVDLLRQRLFPDFDVNSVQNNTEQRRS